ncbi:MAG: YdcF family protein [Bacteroidales bacterium]|nr:YdcF family protein [Bacteroidales bacterium]
MKLSFKNTLQRADALFRRILLITGILSLFLIVFAFTSGPFWMYYHLGTRNIDFSFEPDCIVLLGGSGMPSESNLIRSYYAAEIAGELPALPLIIALPGDTSDTASAVFQLAGEMILRGIKTERILFETDGLNTRAQALNTYRLLSDSARKSKIVIVTSPEHMRRSVLSFRKAGFENVGGYPAFEFAIESDITAVKDDLGGNRFIPDVNKSISLRYRFWTHLKYEVMIIREYVALAYYKLKGWI